MTTISIDAKRCSLQRLVQQPGTTGAEALGAAGAAPPAGAGQRASRWQRQLHSSL